MVIARPSARPSEEQWELLTTLLELSVEDRFELVLVACSERAVEEAFYWRLEEHCKKEERPFLAPALGEDPLDWLTELRGAHVEGTGKARVLFLRLPEAKRVFILHRLNENRDNLRREVRGVLCLVGGPDFLRVVPNEAPDLWSVREKTFELASLRLHKARDQAPIEAPPRGTAEPGRAGAFLGGVSKFDWPLIAESYEPEGPLLTPREEEIMRLLVHTPDRADEIASKLEMTPRTVRKHIESLYRKLKVRSRSELMMIARTRLRAI